MAKLNGGDEQMIRFIVDKFHVGTPLAEVGREILRRAKGRRTWRRGADKRGLLAQAVRFARRRHLENRDLYVRVMSGRL